MRHTALLTTTAVVELAAALALLVLPELALELLFGGGAIELKTALMARFTGTALLAIAVACWRGRAVAAAESPLVAGALAYNVAVTALLAYAGSGLGFAGVLLWPAVALHVALTGWCAASLTGSKTPVKE